MDPLVVIRGGGDLATGIAHRLHRVGYNIVITEAVQPTVIRRTVAFAQSVYEGEVVVEGVTARCIVQQDIHEMMALGIIPVVIDPAAHCINDLRPHAVIDAIIAKRNLDTKISHAPIVIGIGPGFAAGVDVHAVVETMRGHDLGRVYYKGTAIPNTGVPGEIGGHTTARIVRAPVAGIFYGTKDIGETVVAGETVGMIGEIPVTTEIAGVLRGLLQSGLTVTPNMKIGDVDPRCRHEHCFTISDKARAIGGGTLEALLTLGGGVKGHGCI